MALPDVPAATNVLGTLGAICWSVQLIPQIILNHKRHSTAGLQRSMMLLWACAGVPLGAYNISRQFNIALRVQPQILSVLSLLTWMQCFYYKDKWALKTCLLVLILTGLLFGGIETGLIFALQQATHRSLHWPTTLIGILSTVLLSAGVLRHYWDIYTHRTVRGISFLFVGIDAAGDVFSLLSLCLVIYSTEFILWCGVFACGGYFNFLPWARMRIRSRRAGRKKSQEVADANADADGEREEREAAVSHQVQVHDDGTSTSVFRTPSSVASERRAAAGGTV